MSGLSAKKWHEAYKNVVILNNPLYTGVRATLCSLCDGASVQLPIAVSADQIQVTDGCRVRFGGAGVYLRNSGNASMVLNAARVNVSGKLVIKSGNHVSAVSIIGGTVDGTTIKASTKIVAPTASFGLASGTTIKAGATVINNAGITVASIGVAKMHISDDIKMASGKKLITNGTTGFYSPSATELHLMISGNGILVVLADSLAPKADEAVSLGTSSERFNNGYIKNLYVNGITASTAIIKDGTFKGSLCSVTAIKTPAANISLLTAASANAAIVRGTKIVMTTVSGVNVKGTTLTMTGDATVTGDMTITGTKINMANLPTASAGLDAGMLYNLAGTIKVKA